MSQVPIGLGGQFHYEIRARLMTNLAYFSQTTPPTTPSPARRPVEFADGVRYISKRTVATISRAA